MITRYRMKINDTQLDQLFSKDKLLADKLVMLNIGYSEPGISRTIETAGDADGGIITRTYRQKASVTANFGLYIYDVAERTLALQKIKTLAAKGGTIRTNDRAGQALYNAVCEQYPEIESTRDWTEPLTMTFSSYAFPYWQDDSPTVKTLSGKYTASSISVPGNAPIANCAVQIVANENFYSGSNVAVTVGNTTIFMTYPMKTGNYCLIDLDSNNNLRLRVYNNTSASALLTNSREYIAPVSSDKLVPVPGMLNTFSISSVTKITATLSVWGAWL